MIRLLVLVVKIALLTALAVWVANRPGDVTIHWQGREVTTSFGILLLVVALGFGVALFLYHLWRGLVGIPGSWALAHLSGRRRRGYLALTQGLVAVAAGDAGMAQRYAGKAEKLLNEPPLTLLLQAQAAQLNGDEDAANRYFNAMLERPEMSFLGVRGLLTQAIKSGDTSSALALARRAYAQQPKTEWVLLSLFDLECRTGNYEAALNLLPAATRQNFMTSERARKLRAMLWLAQGRQAHTAGDKTGASYHAQRAHALWPAFVPAAEAYAAALKQAGKTRAAEKVIERTWRQSPHPGLASLYAGLASSLPPLEQVKRLERLKALDLAGHEGPVAVAEAALHAKLWGQARAELTALADKTSDVRSFRLLAELEEAERADSKAAQAWLEKAAQAPARPAWSCTTCHAPQAEWHPLCPECSAFGTLEWRTGPNATRFLPLKSS